ncbi:MAG: DUF4384 domain-containing protein [Gemmatimonadetes bacterium]|nr:DUF4384 domain-containing protein [Gemmatimonadota bacterium]
MTKIRLYLSTFVLVLSTFAGGSLAAQRAADPPVQVRLSGDGDYGYGDRARVFIETRADGYVVLFHVTADGRIRPLYPLQPGGDHFVKGGKRLEIRGLGGREAFVTDDTTGRGVVFAAYSQSAFGFGEFERNGHWDYRALADSSAAVDPEAALMDLVQKMQPSVHFDYDLVTYVVGQGRYARRPGGMWPYPMRGGWWSDLHDGRPRVIVSVGIGSRFFRPYGYYSYGYYSPWSFYVPVVRAPIGRWRY